MKLVWVPLGLGAGLVAWGLISSARATGNKAEKPLPKPPASGLIPEHDASVVPQHSQGDQQSPNYCQLLTAYEQELRKWESLRDDAERRMREAEREAQTVCQNFAWNASWEYKYEGFLGLAGYTVFHKYEAPAVRTQCVNYVKGKAGSPGSPKIQNPPSRGAYWYDGSYTSVADQIRALKVRVEQARAALPGIREEYLKAKKEHDQAQQKINELRKKIADLEAQGVYC